MEIIADETHGVVVVVDVFEVGRIGDAEDGRCGALLELILVLVGGKGLKS